MGIGCRELELLQLPSSIFIFVLVVHNPGGGSVTNLSTRSVVRNSGQGMMVKLCDVHVENRCGLCLVVMYHSFIDMNCEHRSQNLKPD